MCAKLFLLQRQLPSRRFPWPSSLCSLLLTFQRQGKDLTASISLSPSITQTNCNVQWIRRVAIRRRIRTPVYSGDRKRCDAICLYATRFAVHNTRNSSLCDSTRLDATRYVYCEPAFTRSTERLPSLLSSFSTNSTISMTVVMTTLFKKR